MSYKLSILALGAALVSVASAVGNARIVNNCDFDVTTWSVGGSVSSPSTISPGDDYSEEYVKDPSSGGKSLKTTLDPDGLYAGDAQTNFAYNLDGSTIWYDLSDTFGDAFSGHKLVVSSSDDSCPTIVWEDGVPGSGSQVKNCGSDADITLTLCA